MRRTIILAFMICGAALAYSQTAAVEEVPAAVEEVPAAVEEVPAAVDEVPAAVDEVPAAVDEVPTAVEEVPAVVEEVPAVVEEVPAAVEEVPAVVEEVPAADAEILAEIERLSAKLEEANGIIDELRGESYDLKSKAEEADSLAAAAREEADAANEMAASAESEAAAAQEAADTAQAKAAAAEAIAAAGEAQLKAAQDAAAKADALSEEAERLKARVSELEAKIAGLESNRDTLYGKLASFGSLRIDATSFPELLRSGFSDSKTRLGTWKLSGAVLAQTDKSQYFSRITFPLVQSSKPVLYSFETRTGAKGWVGAGIHLFAEGVKKSKGYGEGKSLLVWLTRDAKVRGNDGSYLQVYRSDNDISMERVLDAKIKERLEGWNRVEVLYEPASEFIVLAVNGSVRAAYRTYFGIGAGVTMSLRTLGEGVQFRNLEVRR